MRVDPKGLQKFSTYTITPVLYKDQIKRYLVIRQLVEETSGKHKHKPSEAEWKELKEMLGTYVGRFSYLTAPTDLLRETDRLISFTWAMLVNKDPDNENEYIHEYEKFRKRWEDALEGYEELGGGWKDSWKICSDINDDLLVIMLREGLVTLKKDMFNVSRAFPDRDDEVRRRRHEQEHESNEDEG